MLLTYKSFWKIVAACVTYFFLGSVCIALSAAFGTVEMTLFWLGMVMYALIPIFFFWLRTAEGTSKPLARGYKLLRRELRPAAFLAEYETLKSSPKLMLCRPSAKLLELVAMAEHLLGHTERALSAVDEMIAASPKKKQTYAKMVKVSYLFDAGQNDEADALFFELRRGKPDMLSQALANAILEGDRAKAIGDDKTYEESCLRRLNCPFPKPDNLGRLVLHFNLAELYEKRGEVTDAVEHYRDCAENGVETALREKAIAALQGLT
jgi:tetratricopeptide (TPR) repeat protein